MKKLFIAGKVGVAIFWISVIYNLFNPLPSPYYQILLGIGVISLIAHIVEATMFWLKTHKSKDITNDIPQILLFGAFHLWSLKTR